MLISPGRSKPPMHTSRSLTCIDSDGRLGSRSRSTCSDELDVDLAAHTMAMSQRASSPGAIYESQRLIAETASDLHADEHRLDVQAQAEIGLDTRAHEAC